MDEVYWTQGGNLLITPGDKFSLAICDNFYLSDSALLTF